MQAGACLYKRVKNCWNHRFHRLHRLKKTGEVAASTHYLMRGLNIEYRTRNNERRRIRMFRHSKFLVQYSIFVFRIWLRPEAAPGNLWFQTFVFGLRLCLAKYLM